MFKRKSKFFRILCGLLIFLLVDSNLEKVNAQTTPLLAHIVSLSPSFSSPVFKGMRVYPNKPFEFDFMVDSGDRHHMDRKEAALLIKYFLTCLTVPEEDLWVNLSPYEAGHIIPDELSRTDAGQTLLEQDKLLKQIASSLTYPETALGKKFWDKVYKRAYQKFGTTDLPVNTYNKVWIVPQKAVVYDMGHSALIGETYLKVMLDEDYLALKKNKIIKDKDGAHQFTALITKELILPTLEREVNTGKNFAPVRQIFYSMVLAAWFKRALKRNVLSNFYVNKKKISGIDGVDKKSKEEIYRQYLRLYKQGAYNYIREDVDPVSKQVLPRKYFSGGFMLGRSIEWLDDHSVSSPAMIAHDLSDDGNLAGIVKVKLTPIGRDPRDTSNAAQISPYKPRAHSGSWKRHALMLAIAVSTSLGFSAVASASTKTPPQAIAIHQPTLKLGDAIGPADRLRLEWLDKQYSSTEVEKDLDGKVNRLAKKKGLPDPHYHVASGSLKGAIADALKKGKLTWAAQDYIFDFQEKHGESPDGQVGDRQVRPEIDQRMRSEIKPAPLPAPLPSVKAKTQPATAESVTVAVSSAKAAGLGAPPPPPPLPEEIVSLAPSFQITEEPDGTSIGDGSLWAGALEGTIRIKSTAILANIKPLDIKSEYKQGEMFASTINLQAETDLKSEQEALRIAEGELEILKKSPSPIDDEVTAAQLKIRTIQARIAQIKTEMAADVLRAPRHLRVTDIRVADGQTVAPGTEILKYVELDRVMFDFDVSKHVGSVDYIDFFINGQKALHYKASLSDSKPKGAGPGGSSDPDKQHLTLIITPAQKIQPGAYVTVSLKIKSPPQGLSALASISTRNQPFTGAVAVPPDNYTEVPASAGGFPQYNVQVGDLVTKGQVLAPIANAGLNQELEANAASIKTNDALRTSYEDDPNKTQFDKNRLIVEAHRLKFKKQKLLRQSGLLKVRAPYTGRITFSAQNNLAAVNTGDVMFRINRGVYDLGDANNPDSPFAIRLPYDANRPETKMKEGEIVLVETEDGDHRRLLGRVVLTHPQPLSMRHGQLLEEQLVRVTVMDPTYSTNLTGRTVRVFQLSADEQSRIARLISLSGSKISSTGASGGKGKPPEKDRLPLAGAQASRDRAMLVSQRWVSALILGIVLAVQSGCSHELPELKPQAPFVISTEDLTPITLDLEQVAVKVGGNILTAPAEQIDVEITKAMEEKPGAPVLNLSADIWRQGGGRFSFEGGIGFMMNSLQGGLSTGNALGAAIPIVSSGIGQLMDLITGKVGKQKDFARTMTKVAVYHLRTKLDGKVYEARDLLISLKEAQEREKELEGLLENLKAIESDTLDRYKNGVLSEMDYLRVQSERIAIEQQMLDNDREIQRLTISLNNLIGAGVANRPIVANVPLTGDIPWVSSQEQIKDSLALIGHPDKSPNPQMQELNAILEATKINFDLDLLGFLPSLNAGLVGSTQDASGAIYDPWSGTWMHPSATQAGTNATVQANLPIFDKGREIETTRVSSEVLRAYRIIEATRRDIAVRLIETQLAMNNLHAAQLKSQEAYATASRLWEITSNTHHYSPIHSLGPLLARYHAQQELERIHAQYLREEARLRQLGLLRLGEALADRAMIAKRVLMLVLAFGLSPFSALAQNFPEGETLASVQENSRGNRIDTSVRSMPGSPVENLVGLLDDASEGHRMDALQALFSGSYAQDGNYWKLLQQALLKSTHPEVQEQMLRYSTQSQHMDLRFFIEVIHKASLSGQAHVRDLGLQYLGDVLAARPALLKELSSHIGFEKDAIYPDVTPQIVDGVLLTFLIEPVNDVVRDLLIESDYWQPFELAQKRQQLILKAGETKDEASRTSMMRTAALLEGALFRKEALVNLHDAFIPASRPGPEDGNRWDPLGLNLGDAKDRTETGEWELESDRFLNGAQWENVLKGEHLNPDLQERTREGVQKVIDAVPIARSDRKGPLFYGYQPVATDSFFTSLRVADQQAYVASSDNYAELSRFLRRYAHLRRPILARLQKSPDWSLWVLQAYTDGGDSSEDRSFSDWVEHGSGINWEKEIDGALKGMKQSMRDGLEKPQTSQSYLSRDRLIRGALIKMVKSNPGHQGLVHLYYQDLTAQELSQIGDKADGYIKFLSWQWALEALKGEYRWVPSWSSSEREPSENRTLTLLDQTLRTHNDAKEVEALLRENQANPLDSKTAKVLGQFMGISADYYKDIKDNNQRIVRWSRWNKFIMQLTGGLVALFVALRIPLKRLKKRKDNQELEGTFEGLIQKFEQDTGLGPTTITEPLEGSLQEHAVKFLDTWRHLLVGWRLEANGGIDWPEGLNTALNLADSLGIALRYTPDLIKKADTHSSLSVEEYRRSLYYYFDFAAWTLYILSKHLRQQKLTDGQRQRLQLAIDKMIQYMQMAVIPYVSVLKDITAIDGVIKEKYPDGDLGERTGYRRLQRMVLFQQRPLDVPRERIPLELKGYLDQADQLVPGLYPNRGELEKQSAERLDQIISEGRSPRSELSKTQGEAYKSANAARRFVFINGIMITIVSFLFSGVIGLWQSISTLINLGAFKHQSDKALSKQTSVLMGAIVQKLKFELRGQLPQDNGAIKAKALAEKEAEAQRQIEMQSSTARVKAFIISVEDPDDIAAIQDQIRGLKKEQFIRDEVPVIIKNFSRLRGSGNAILEMVSEAKETLPWRESAYILFAQNSTYRDNPEPLRWAILNTYRAVAQGAKASVIYAKDPYYGEVKMPKNSDVALMLSRVSGRELPEGAFIIRDTKTSKVMGIREHLHIDGLLHAENQGEVPADLVYLREQGMALDNRTVSIYSVFNGMMLLSQRAVETLGTIAQETASERQGLSRVRLFEVLEVLRKRDILGFMRERWNWPDYEAVGDMMINGGFSLRAQVLLKFYSLMQDKAGDIKIDYFLPQRGGDDAAQIADSKHKGGIDLNFQPQFIDKGTQGSSETIDSPVIPGTFQGFNFNIVRFIPQLSVTSAVELMVGSN